MDNQTAGAAQDRSLGELFAQLLRDMGALMRQEMASARRELAQNASKAGKDVAMVAAGGVVAYTGVIAVVAGVILLLMRARMPGWGAALLVGVVIAAAGAVMVNKGLKALKTDNLAPTETINQIKEDASWLKQQTS